MGKKNTNNMCDVTMGSYEGDETCELVDAQMLSLIASKLEGVEFYRDDSLAVCEVTPRGIEKSKQEVSNAFKSNGPKLITFEANKNIETY